MPQEPQQVNLEELSRLHDKHCIHGRDTTEFIAPLFSALFQSFPALRDELVTARKNNKDLLQDSCDVQEAAIECAKSFGVCVDNGPGYGQPNIFQLLEDIQKAGETMRDELVRLRASNAMNEDAANKGDNARQAAGAMESEISRLQDENGKLEKQRNNWKSFADKLQKANISKTRQLDEAKGLLELLVQEDSLLKHHEPRSSSLGSLARDASAFLAGQTTECKMCDGGGLINPKESWSDNACPACKGTGDQQEQPTQGEVWIHDWQLHQGAVVYKCTKCGDKTTTPTPEAEGGASHE